MSISGQEDKLTGGQNRGGQGDNRIGISEKRRTGGQVKTRRGAPLVADPTHANLELTLDSKISYSTTLGFNDPWIQKSRFQTFLNLITLVVLLNMTG